MRRFVAYVLASLTIFLGIGVAFKPVATKINADLSYRNGNTIYFRLEERTGGKTFIDYEGKAAQYYANAMTERLESYGVADYKINVEGEKYISVTLTSENLTECENIGKLLATNPEIQLQSLPNSAEKIDEQVVADKPDENVTWHSSKAYLAFDGTTTVVVMPIPDKLRQDTKTMIEAAKKYEEKAKTSNDDEPKKTANSIILWMNRLDGEEYSKDKKDTLIEKKVVYTNLNSTNFYYGSGESAFQLRFTPTSSKVSDISASYKQAMYMMNLLNAKEVDFDCVVTKTVPAAATVENLLIYGDHITIAMSSTFISMMIAFILICLLLALFYRLGAVAIVSTASLNTFLSFTLFVFFKPLFNIAALVGVISVFAISVFLGVLYNHYLHEEVYKGRSLKKANFEASKKTTLITVDMSVIAMILGICVYFIGGRTVSSLGVILICASIFNLFINTFVLKGLMWLITNNTHTQKEYKLLGIDSTKVPDLAKSEKPSYVGPYEKKNFTKKKKLSALIFGGLTAASCIGMIIFASVTKDVFNSKQFYEQKTTLHLVLQGKSEPTTSDQIKNVYLAKIKHNGKDLSIGSDINTYNYVYYYRDATGEVQDTNHYVYDITINDSNVDAEEFTVNDSNKQSLSECLPVALIDLSSSKVDEFNESLVTSKIATLPSNVGIIYGATSVAIVVTGLYFWIRRYRLSRVVPTITIALASNVIALGAITLARIPATPVMAIGIGLTSLYTILATQFLMHKEKDILRDERLKNVETRKLALDKSLHVSALPLINFTIVITFITLCFLAISNKTFSGVFFSTTLSMAVSTIMILTLFTPFADILDKKLSTVKLPEIKIRRKKKKIVQKSNEPEEAIFIGIND